MNAVIGSILFFTCFCVYGKDMSQFAKPSNNLLKEKLTSLQYKVTQESGTEKPFDNQYWNEKGEGIYVDIVSGEPLFSSLDKFDSGTGWPSFKAPLEKESMVERVDQSLFMKRVEVRSKNADSHLGHLFQDGPKPTGLRYCINSAALRFIPRSKLKDEGYEKYLSLFEASLPKDLQTATLAGGCFWGVEELLRKLPGVIETTVGYTGGTLESPVYEKVKKGNTGHAESVQVKFDPKILSYEALIQYFFRLHDPTTLNQQGNDRGTQYRSTIFYHNEEQKLIAEKVTRETDKSGKWKKPVVTQVVLVSKFYPAEEYHQKYLKKNPNGYTCHFVRD